MLTRERHTAERTGSLDNAFRYCERLTRRHYENFPVASLFIPADKRKHVSALYAFARIADDFADEPGMTLAERMDALNDWGDQLVDCYHGRARHPVFVALSDTVERFEIPIELFQRLLTAFRSDVTTHRYETFDDVLAYCRNSADPVGRLVLLLFNYRSERMMQHADAICTALQLTNFWQDLSIDLEKNRLYVPLADLQRFGHHEEELFARRTTVEFRYLMASLVDRTEHLFRRGKPLLEMVGRDLRFELRLTWRGGMRILRKIKQQQYDVFTKRPVLMFRDTMALVLSSWHP